MWTKLIDRAAYYAALAMAGYHLVSVVYRIQGPGLHVETHLMSAFLVAYLGLARKSDQKWRKHMLAGIALLSVVIMSYMYVNYDGLALRLFFNTPLDLAMGVVLIILAIDATRRAWGWVVPAMIIIALVYPFIGSNLPEPFKCSTYTWQRVISNLALSSSTGLRSTALSISVNYLYLFIVFGSVFAATGAVNFFKEAGRWVGSKIKGGAAVTSVMSSAAVGSLTGSVVANISITGAFTIPSMRAAGYTDVQAAAIEAAASNGGQILPPIMGILAFLMAGYTGIPYGQICLMALLPALFYYLNTFLYVLFQAGKMKIGKLKAQIDRRELMFDLPKFIVPFGVIIYLLVMGRSVLMVGFWAIISTVAMSLIRKKTRPSLMQLLDGFVDGSTNGALLAVMMAAAGILIQNFTMTGLGIKLGAGIEMWSGGSIPLLLAIVWVIGVIMGMVGISLVAYLIVAMFVVTGMVGAGIPFEVAHFFIIFPCMFAGLTPPIAVFAMVAARMAGAPWVKVAIESVKMAGLGLVFPFMIVVAPVLVMMPASPIEGAMHIIAMIVMILAAQICFAGFFVTPCSRLERVVFGVVAIASLLFYFLFHNYVMFGGILVGFIIPAIRHWKRSKEVGVAS
ncbi:MAG: TRAP transporter fused permease subunit [Dehalococcoidia bacterium]